jgi:hypothetical protein
MPRLSELQGAAPVRLSQVQAQRPAYQRVDPSTIKTEVDAHAAAFLAERAGDTEAAAALRARGDQLFADSMSGWDQFWAGAGKSVVDTGRGIGQLFGAVDEREVAEARARDEALMNTGAGLVGNITGQGLQMAVPLGSGGKVASVLGKSAPYVNAAVRGATFGGLQGTVGDESRAGNAALGGLLGAAGQGAADVVGRAARGVDMDAVTRGLLGKADDIGLRLNAGQLTQNPMLRNAMSQMERLPFSGGRAVQEANHSAFNRAVADTIGATDDKITADVFRAAKGRIGGAFERLSSQNNLQATPELLARLNQIKAEAQRLGNPDTARSVGAWVDELLGKVESSRNPFSGVGGAPAGGTIPGRAYQAFDSKVGQVMKAGGEPAHYLGNLREAVRGAMDNSIAPADQAAWRLARQQWGNLKTIEPLVAKSTTGDIPPAQLMGRVTADNAGKVRMASGGGGRLGELAQVGSRFLKEAPDTGTADRALVNVGVLGGLLGLQQTEVISPEAAALTAGLLGGNRAALGLLRNPGVIRGASPVLQGAARTAAAARTVPAAMGNARQRERTLEIDIVGGRPITLEEARRLQGL